MRNCTSILSALLVLGLSFSLPVYAGHTLIKKPDADDPMQVWQYELDNGLQIFLTHNPERPRFYAEIPVRVGSIHDPAETTGLAHYLEHLMFKGSQKLGTLDWEKEKPLLDEIRDLYETHFTETDPAKRAELYKKINATSQKAAQFAVPNEFTKVATSLGGGDLNAHTSVEETVYKMSMPKTRLEAWAKLEADRFLQPVFRLFHTELEIVYEEKNRSNDNASRSISEAVSAALYQKHPYGQQTTLGSPEHLKNPSIKKIEEYFQTWYVPNNMAVCISGDIDIEKTIAILDKEFSVWKRKELPEQKTFVEPPIDKIRKVEVNFPGQEQVSIAFRTVPRGHKDLPALKLVDMLMDNSAAGLINLNLNQAQKVRQAGSYPSVLNEYGAQYFYGVPKAGQKLEEVEKLILEQVEKVKKGEFDDWLLPAIITDYKIRERQRLEDNEQRITLLRDAFLQKTPWDVFRNEVATLEAVTKKEIVAAANKYFGEGYVVGYRRDKERKLEAVEKPQIDPLSVNVTDSSAFAKELLAMKAEPITPRFLAKDAALHSQPAQGVDLHTTKNPFNDLFSLTVIIDEGSRVNTRLNMLQSFIDKAGTKTLSSGDMKTEWYKIGSSFSIGVTPHETVFALSGIDGKLSESLDLMNQLLSEANMKESDFKELIRIIKGARADEVKTPQSLHRALMIYNRLGDNSPFLNRLSGKDLDALEAADFSRLLKSLLRRPRTIHYTGSLSEAEVIKQLAKTSLLRPSTGKPRPYPVLVPDEVAENRIYLLDHESAQSLVRIEFADGLFDPTAQVDMDLFRNYFGGGMSSVVFQQLREARSLAYSAWGYYFPPARPNEYNISAGFIGTQCDKTCDALEAFLDLYENLPMEEADFEETRNSLDAKFRTEPLGFRQTLGSIRSWKNMGYRGNPRPKQFEQVTKANLNNLKRFHADRIKGNAKMISIVGKKSDIDMERLATFGEIIEIKADQIFKN